MNYDPPQKLVNYKKATSQNGIQHHAEHAESKGHKTFKPTILQHNEQQIGGQQRLSDLQLNQNYVPRPSNMTGLNSRYQELNSFAFQNFEKGFNFNYQSESRRDSFNQLADQATQLNSNAKSSFGSTHSPFRDNFLTTFDFNSDLNTDLSEFNDFFSKSVSQYNQIERPQNPFEKNFESYKQTTRNTQRNSLTIDSTRASSGLQNVLKKTPSMNLEVN